jgi:hypothetical protein
MRVLEGRRAFAEGLGEIEFKGLKKTLISQKIFFCFVFYLVFYCLEGRKYQKQIEHMVQLQNFFFFLIFMVVLGGTTAPILFQWLVSRDVRRSFFSWYYNTYFYLSIIGFSLYTF